MTGPRPSPLAPGVWLLGTHHYDLYLVRGTAGSALVEAGVSAVIDQVLGQLDALGVEPDHLVVTHPHADHLGGLPALRQRYPRARVVVGPGAAAFVAHPRAGASAVAEDRHLAGSLAALGVRPGRPPLAEPPTLAGCAEVQDGDTLDLGGVTLRLLAVAGHSPGGLAVHVPERAVLLASDSLGFCYPGRGFLPLFFTGLAPYLATLARLEALAPRVLGLGHQGPVTGATVPETFAAARHATLALADRVRAWPGDPADLAAALFREFYVDELATYSPGNIRGCVDLLIRRVGEA